MLESNRIGINFAGKDGFHWFIGQVTADYAWRDKNNQNVEAGFRAKVRILGHHPPESEAEGGIDDFDLPWAHFLVSPQFGAGHNKGGTSFALQGGETVFGFFLDGEEGQQPVILGCFHANSGAEAFQTWEDVKGKATSGFFPFENDKSIEDAKYNILINGEKERRNGGTPDSNSKFDKKEGGGEFTADKGKSILRHIDDTPFDVEVAQKCIAPSGALGEASKVLQSFIDEVSGLEKFQDKHIDPVLNRIVDMDKLILKASNKIAGGFSAAIRQARKEMLKEVDEQVSKAISFLDPAHLIKNIEIRKQTDQIYCLIENVLNGLQSFVGDFLKGLVGNLLQFPLCAAEQFFGGLISGISDKIQGLIGPSISSIQSVAGGISLPPFASMMDKAVKIAQAGLALLACEGNECEPEPLDWKINVGADPKKKLDFGRIINLASGLSAFGGLGDAINDPIGALSGIFPGIEGVTGAFSKLSGISGDLLTLKQGVSGGIPTNMKSLIGGCDPFTKRCGPPKLTIFGGGGSGAVGKAVVNSIGKVVGVNMSSFGSGFTSPPFVTITDNCNNGKGATATAEVDLDESSPTFGQIKDIVITNPGGGYVGPGVIDTIINVDTGEEITTPTGTTTLPNGTVVPITRPSVGTTTLPDGTVVPITDTVTGTGAGTGATSTGTGTAGVGAGTGTADDEGIDVIGEVSGVQVISPGIGFKSGDTITTPSGGVIVPILDEKGRIVGVDPNTKVDVGLIDIPKLTVNTNTGFGALLRPITRFTKVQDYEDPIVPDAKLIRVIDCPRGF